MLVPMLVALLAWGHFHHLVKLFVSMGNSQAKYNIQPKELKELQDSTQCIFVWMFVNV